MDRKKILVILLLFTTIELRASWFLNWCKGFIKKSSKDSSEISQIESQPPQPKVVFTPNPNSNTMINGTFSWPNGRSVRFSVSLNPFTEPPIEPDTPVAGKLEIIIYRDDGRPPQTVFQKFVPMKEYEDLGLIGYAHRFAQEYREGSNPVFGNPMDN